MTNHPTTRLLGLGALLATACVLTACRGDREDAPPRQFFPDLDDQQKWNPQSAIVVPDGYTSQEPIFSDGRTMRLPPAGTVPFGRLPVVPNEEWASKWNHQRDDFLKDDARFYTGVESIGADGKPVYVAMIPASVSVDRALIERGQDRFNIYCAACHGYQGDGKGTVGKLFNPIVPSFTDPTFFDPAPTQLRTRDGWIFHTIRNGKAVEGVPGKYTMPPYGHAVNERDAWAIVAYVRVLQASRKGAIEDVPGALREQLQKIRPNPAPATTTGGAQ